MPLKDFPTPREMEKCPHTDVSRAYKALYEAYGLLEKRYDDRPETVVQYHAATLARESINQHLRMMRGLVERPERMETPDAATTHLALIMNRIIDDLRVIDDLEDSYTVSPADDELWTTVVMKHPAYNDVSDAVVQMRHDF